MRYAVWAVAGVQLLGALMNLNTAGKLTAKGHKKFGRQTIGSALIGLTEVAVLTVAGFHW